jgi:transposase
MKPYSKDRRLRVLATVDRGMPREKIVRLLGVPTPTTKRRLRLRRHIGDVEPKPVSGPPPRKGAAIWAVLGTQEARGNLDLTLSEHCDNFEEQVGVRVSTATMSRAGPRST